MAQYIQVACEELTEDPLAPRVESYVGLLEALLIVRGLRTHRGTGLDLYYLGNLEASGNWNDRTIAPEVMPQVVGTIIQRIRASGHGRKAVGVGRNLYVALRDEELEGIASLSEALSPFMAVLFRMSARGHWIQEHRPIAIHEHPPCFCTRFLPQIAETCTSMCKLDKATLAFASASDRGTSLTSFLPTRKFVNSMRC